MALQNSLSAVGDRYAIIPTSAGSTIVVLAKSFCHGNILPDFGSGFITCSGIMSLIAIAVIVCVCMMVFLRLKIYYYYYEADYYLNNQPNKR